MSSSRRRSPRTASTASAQAPAKVRRYPGLKEEYYLHGFTPDAAVLDELGLDRTRTIVVVRTPPDVSLYHREANPLFGDVLERLGRDPAVHAVVLPRTTDQRAEIAARALPSIHVPERAVDAQSLVALSDLVVSAGGTMNREAVALGVPAYTTFAGKLGAVDRMLVDEGRLRVLASSRRPRAGEAHATRPCRRRANRRFCSTSCSPRSSPDPVSDLEPSATGGLEVAERAPTAGSSSGSAS